MAYSLIRANMPCRIQGRDIGQGLKTLITKLVKGDAPTATLLTALDAWQAKESAAIATRLASRYLCALLQVHARRRRLLPHARLRAQ